MIIARLREEFNHNDICKIFIIWWHIWFVRKKLVFMKKGLVPSKVVASVIRFLKDWDHANNVEDLSIPTSKLPSSKNQEV